MPAICSGESPASEPVNWASRTLSVSSLSRCSLVSPRQTIGISRAAERGVELAIDLRVGLAHAVAALAVAQDHMRAAGIDQHRGRELAGVGPAGLPVHVLGTQPDRRALEDRVDLAEEDGRRAEDDAHAGRLADAGLDRLRQGHGFGARRRVHLPVARDQQGAHVTRLSFTHVDRLAEQLGELADFVHEPVELVGNEGLRAVGEGAFGAGMDLDVDSVAARGDGGPGHGGDQVGPAGGVAGVDDDRQVALALDVGHDRQVEGIAGRILEGADSSLAEDHLAVAFGEDVLGRHEQVFHGRAHAAFEQDRDPGAAAFLEQVEVLHVPAPIWRMSA